MAYYDLNLLAQDLDFALRTTACAASEGIPEPESWQNIHRWEVAAAPGFADAYASALANSVPNPGRDPSVISDAQLLSAVRSRVNPPTDPTAGCRRLRRTPRSR